MPTVKEIRTEWKAIRSALGNLMCYIDGKCESLGDLETVYQKGMADGKAEFEKEAYERGLNDAWEAAKTYCVDMTYDEVVKCFGEFEAEDNWAFFSIAPEVIIEKIREYNARKKDEIHFGDEVEAWDTNQWVKFIAVGDEGDGKLVGFDAEGGSYLYPIESCRKTGKRYRIVGDEK